MGETSLDKSSLSNNSVFSIRVVPLILALCASGLIAWCVSLIADESHNLLSGIVCGIMCACILGISVSATPGRLATMIRTTGSVFFILALIVSIFLAYVDASYKSYIITDGLILIIFLSIVYSLARSNQ